LTVSVVSHGHDRWLPGLLQQLAATGAGQIARVILTHNLPAQSPLQVPAGLPFLLTQLTNPSPLGFGANHNRAFEQVTTPAFCVLNPDIELPDPRIWSRLLHGLGEPGAGCVYPVLLNADGSRQDNARAVPTPWALFLRRVLHQPDRRTDWVSAAFWVLPSEVYRSLGGFDERYFMYCEDADFCLRLQLGGWRLVPSEARAIHHAQRSSHRRWRHLAWHVRSLLRLWTGQPLRAYRRTRPAL
jgi:N-acetylglucosaminyl-diphospho-decaprenol L-rhamnosyltransferase